MQLIKVHNKCRQQLHLARAFKLWSMVWTQNWSIIERQEKTDSIFLNTMSLLTFQGGKRGKESEEGAQLQWLANITWAKDGLSAYLTAEKTFGELFYTRAEKNTKLLSWNSVITASCLCWYVKWPIHSHSTFAPSCDFMFVENFW